MKRGDWDKVSKNYYTEILSPIKDSMKNPLFEDIKKIKAKKSKIVADLGCGVGELAKILSSNFKEVIALDFSEKMIKLAKTKAKNKNLKNIQFLVKDISKLKEFQNKIDVAIAINSIITKDLLKINQMFKEIHNILKNKGIFLAILPSMEVYLYQSMLIANKELKKSQNKTKSEIKRKIRQEIKKGEHDFLLGMTNFQGKQKNYYRFEILWRLKKAGFKNIKIKKVFYSWKEFREAGQTYFPKEDPPWDWYVYCEK